jgi:hypothetical protein
MTECALAALRPGAKAAGWRRVHLRRPDTLSVCAGRSESGPRASMTDEHVVAQHRLGSEGVGRDELGRTERARFDEHSVVHLPKGSRGHPAR